MSRFDPLLIAAESALRTLFAPPQSAAPSPTGTAQTAATPTALSAQEKALSGALMRVNHVGEVCAQALYTAQALSTSNPALKAHYQKACLEETEHLAWTQERLAQLGSRTSWLNPLWYGGSFALGLVAGRLSAGLSLGFVVETEAQVQAHLESHLERLPDTDLASRAIVAQMRDDEARHGQEAREAGALELPQAVKVLMQSAAKLMTTTAHYV